MPSKIKTCGYYREALTDAVVEGVEPSRELRLHLDACASCLLAFTEEVQLFAAIDTGLRASANAEVPASLLPRVRVQLNEQPVPRHSWVPIGAAVASGVVLLAVIMFVRALGSGAAGVNRDVNSLAHDVPRPVIQAVSPGIASVERASKTEEHRSFRPVRNGRVAQAEELTVLIPAGQKQAVNALLASVREGKAKENFLLAEEVGGPTKETGVAPLVILPIEVKPLDDLSAEPPSEDGKTKR
jgi:hypothetical protein